jgi:hypothetical protein
MPGADADAQSRSRSRGAGRGTPSATTVNAAGAGDTQCATLARLPDEALVELIQRQTFR